MDHPRLIVRALSALFLLAIVPLQAGCWFPLGESWGRSDRVAEFAPIDWPERDMAGVRAVSEATPELLYDLRITDPSLASPEAIAEAELPRYRIIDNRLTEHGLLRVFEQRFDSEADRGFADLFEGFVANAMFVSSATLSSDEESQERIDEITEAREESPGTQRTFDRYRHRIRDGVGIYLPDPESTPAPRGIVVHFRGLISTSYEEAFVDGVVDSDWLVIRVGTHTDVVTPRDERSRQRFEEQSLRQKQLIQEFRDGQDPDDPASRRVFAPIPQIFLQVLEELPPVSRGFDVSTGANLASVGEQIANAVDSAFAESAYAAEAALEHYLDAHPELRDLPIAVLGCSAGAISSPAVAARLDERFGEQLSAIVMIGGGADLMRIDRRTALAGSRQLRLFNEDDVELKGDTWDAVHEAYLEHVQLDGVAAGPRLRRVPTLIIRAGFDAWVPASTGSKLVRAFGTPDRDWHPGGHQTLFYFLEGRAPRVVRWLNRNTPEPVSAAERVSTVAP